VVGSGCRTWSHATFPCPCCKCVKSDLSKMDIPTNVGIGFDLYSQQDYREEINQYFKVVLSKHLCLNIVAHVDFVVVAVVILGVMFFASSLISSFFAYIKVIRISTEDHKKVVLEKLKYQPKKSGPGGRMLIGDIPELGLKRGDRLEPTDFLDNVANFVDMIPPFDVCFFTGLSTNRILHISPLFSIPGVSFDSWCIDLLHAWHLHGPLAAYIGTALHAVLSNNCFLELEGLDAEEKVRLGMLHLKSHLWQYYKNKRQDPNWQKTGTEVLVLTKIFESIASKVTCCFWLFF